MAFNPPPISEIAHQMNNLLGKSGLSGEIDKNMRALIQSALSNLDIVSREEFDSQAEILRRTRAKVEELEQLLLELSQPQGKSDTD